MKKIYVLILLLSLSSLLSGCVTLSSFATASLEGDVKFAKRAIDGGDDVNERDSLGWTPLMWAAASGQMEITKLLIDKGANIDTAIRGCEQASAHFGGGAMTNGKERCVTLLTKIKADMNQAPQPARDRPIAVATAPSQDVSTIIKSDVDDLPVVKARTNRNAYAIVIGIEQYRQKLPKADFAVRDAKLVSEYLHKVMGFPEENIVTLTNEHASKSDFEKYFEKWLFNNVEKDSTVFIYYSGHGAPNPKTVDAYLVPYDGDPTFIAETGYSLKRAYKFLGKLPAKEIIVALDSCFSGAGGRSVLAKGARPLVMNLQDNISLPKNMTVLSASSGDQISSTYDEKGHGLFTYFMLKGIKNEDVIKTDGSIAIGDLFSYLKPQVERIARKQYNNEQTPQLFGTKKN